VRHQCDSLYYSGNVGRKEVIHCIHCASFTNLSLASVSESLVGRLYGLVTVESVLILKYMMG